MARSQTFPARVTEDFVIRTRTPPVPGTFAPALRPYLVSKVDCTLAGTAAIKARMAYSFTP